MTSPAPKPSAEQEPDFYVGTSFATREMELGLKVMSAKVRDLIRANERGLAVDQKLAAEGISKLCVQIKDLADVVARVTISHINRSQS